MGDWGWPAESCRGEVRAEEQEGKGRPHFFSPQLRSCLSLTDGGWVMTEAEHSRPLHPLIKSLCPPQGETPVSIVGEAWGPEPLRTWAPRNSGSVVCSLWV